MTHLPFIAAAYAATIGAYLLLSVSAVLRLRSARRKLRAVETRRVRA